MGSGKETQKRVGLLLTLGCALVPPPGGAGASTWPIKPWQGRPSASACFVSQTLRLLHSFSSASELSYNSDTNSHPRDTDNIHVLPFELRSKYAASHE